MKQNSKEFSLSDSIVRHKSITKGNLQMLASNDNQLTLHVKIIFREYSQISTSYYTSLSEKFRKKKITKLVQLSIYRSKTQQAYTPDMQK